MAGDEPSSTPPQSAIDTASERLEAYLKTRRPGESGADAAPEEADREPEPEAPRAGPSILMQPDAARDGRSAAPRWMKIVLALALIVAAAEAAYILWRPSLPASPAAELSAPPSPPEEDARAPAAAPAARSADETTPAARDADGAADNTATSREPAEASSSVPATVTTGSIEIRTTPPGAAVVFGGRPQGTTPLTLREVPPGLHELEVGGWFGSRAQHVRVEAGRTTRVELTVPAPR